MKREIGKHRHIWQANYVGMFCEICRMKIDDEHVLAIVQQAEDMNMDLIEKARPVIVVEDDEDCDF